MVNVCDISLEKFELEIAHKYLFIYGAGIRAKRFLDECNIKKSLVAVVDKNKNLQGQVFYRDERKVIGVISYNRFLEYVESLGVDNVALLITPVFYTVEILEKLNKTEELSGLNCYTSELLMNFYEKQSFGFTKGKQMIPKKIHYCWFGESQLPQRLQACIDTWKIKCPDYEIIRWDESNYDISKCKYMKEAYECKKWGFVPDYARLDIIYNEGGIYLDTDVELINNLDKLLNDKAFFGFTGEMCINMGSGFGATKENTFVKELRDVYDIQSFYNQDGSLNMRPCTYYQHPVFKKHGFSLKNEYQNKNDIVIYPSEVFSPMGIIGGNYNFTENTMSIHHAELSWISEEELEDVKKYRQDFLNEEKSL